MKALDRLTGCSMEHLLHCFFFFFVPKNVFIEYDLLRSDLIVRDRLFRFELEKYS